MDRWNDPVEGAMVIYQIGQGSEDYILELFL